MTPNSKPEYTLQIPDLRLWDRRVGTHRMECITSTCACKSESDDYKTWRCNTLRLKTLSISLCTSKLIWKEILHLFCFPCISKVWGLDWCADRLLFPAGQSSAARCWLWHWYTNLNVQYINVWGWGGQIIQYSHKVQNYLTQLWFCVL